MESVHVFTGIGAFAWEIILSLHVLAATVYYFLALYRLWHDKRAAK